MATISMASSLSLSYSQTAAARVGVRGEAAHSKGAMRLAPTPSGLTELKKTELKKACAAAQVAAPVADRWRVAAAYASDVDQGYGGSQAYGGTPSPSGTKLYCGNLPFNVDNETLAGLFQDHANVEQADVVYDRDTNRSRGFGFVIMATVEDAQAAIDALDGQEYGGRALKVNFPKQSGASGGDRFERPPRERRMDMASPGSGNKVYVGNLAWGVDDDALSNLFSNFGNVLEAKVVLDRETGRSRGFGFVTFETPDEGNDAVNQMNNAEIEGRVLRVSIANDRPSGSRTRY